MNSFIDYLKHLEETRFWGAITLQYKDGEVVLLDQNQKIKINQQPLESRSRKNHRESRAQTDGRHESVSCIKDL